MTTQSMLGPNSEDLNPQDVDGLFIVATPPPNPVGGTVEVLSAPGSSAGGVWVVALAGLMLVITSGVITLAWKRARR